METQGEAPYALPPWPVWGTHGAEMFGAAPAEGRGGGLCVHISQFITTHTSVQILSTGREMGKGVRGGTTCYGSPRFKWPMCMQRQSWFRVGGS